MRSTRTIRVRRSSYMIIATLLAELSCLIEANRRQFGRMNVPEPAISTREGIKLTQCLGEPLTQCLMSTCCDDDCNNPLGSDARWTSKGYQCKDCFDFILSYSRCSTCHKAVTSREMIGEVCNKACYTRPLNQADGTCRIPGCNNGTTASQRNLNTSGQRDCCQVHGGERILTQEEIDSR